MDGSSVLILSIGMGARLVLGLHFGRLFKGGRVWEKDLGGPTSVPLIGSLNSIMVSGTYGSVSTGHGDKQTAAMLGHSSCLSVCSTVELVVPRKGDLGSQSTCSGLGWCTLNFLCELDGAAACCCGPSCCTSQLGPLQGWLELYHSR